MKSLLQAVVVASLSAPLAVFAQSNQPITRAEVRAQLVQLEQAGYRPGDGDQATYPVQIQAAEAKVSAEGGNTGVGGVADASTTSGHKLVSKSDWDAMYSHP